jgi:hypothetical protein
VVESFGKLIGDRGARLDAGMGYRTPGVGVGVATWAIRRERPMIHWRESANLMRRNWEHVTGTYSDAAKKGQTTYKRSEYAKGQDEEVHAAARRVGRRAPRSGDAPCERHQPQAHGAATDRRGSGRHE